MPDAARVADEIKASLGIDAELIAGSGGIFEVVADGDAIYQKSVTGRFPDVGEIAGILRQQT